jgi:hypothetical protein
VELIVGAIGLVLLVVLVIVSLRVRAHRHAAQGPLREEDFFRGHNDLTVGKWTPNGHRQVRIAFHDGRYTVAVTGGAEPLVLGTYATLAEAEEHVRQAAATLA